MTSKRIAQTNQQQKSDKPKESGILQRAAVRPVSDAGMQSTDDKEVQSLSNSAFSKDFSQVPISTTKPQPIMAKLMIGAVGDKYEQEADRVAAQVVQRINAPASVRSGEDETVQREKMETKNNEAKLMRSPILQRKSSDGGMAATSDLESSINRARSGGQPMANNIRQPMEKAFGADFSGVKVHTDYRANQLNQSIQAKAFTTGQDVFFRQGEYNPGNRGGQELIAHELTHVVQQTGGACQQQRDVRPEVRQIEIQRQPIKIQRLTTVQPNNWNQLSLLVNKSAAALKAIKTPKQSIDVMVPKETNERIVVLGTYYGKILPGQKKSLNKINPGPAKEYIDQCNGVLKDLLDDMSYDNLIAKLTEQQTEVGKIGKDIMDCYNDYNAMKLDVKGAYTLYKSNPSAANRGFNINPRNYNVESKSKMLKNYLTFKKTGNGAKLPGLPEYLWQESTSATKALHRQYLAYPTYIWHL